MPHDEMLNVQGGNSVDARDVQPVRHLEANIGRYGPAKQSDAEGRGQVDPGVLRLGKPPG